MYDDPNLASRLIFYFQFSLTFDFFDVMCRRAVVATKIACYCNFASASMFNIEITFVCVRTMRNSKFFDYFFIFIVRKKVFSYAIFSIIDRLQMKSVKRKFGKINFSFLFPRLSRTHSRCTYIFTCGEQTNAINDIWNFHDIYFPHIFLHLYLYFAVVPYT